MSHQLLASTRDWDDDAPPLISEGAAQNGEVAAACHEAGTAESSDGASDAIRPGRQRPSSGGSRQAVRLETVSEYGGSQDVPLEDADGRQPQKVVSEDDDPQAGGAVREAGWRQSGDQRRVRSIEMVLLGEAGQIARGADIVRAGSVGSEPASAAPSEEAGSAQRQIRSWFSAPGERSPSGQVWSSDRQHQCSKLAVNNYPLTCLSVATALLFVKHAWCCGCSHTSPQKLKACLLDAGAESTAWVRDRRRHYEGHAADAVRSQGPARLRTASCQRLRPKQSSRK